MIGALPLVVQSFMFAVRRCVLFHVGICYLVFVCVARCALLVVCCWFLDVLFLSVVYLCFPRLFLSPPVYI